MGQMVHFPNGAKSGEKTAANGAAPHFGIRRNFFWLHSFSIFDFRLVVSKGCEPRYHPRFK